ncbi:DUF4232 domain-containing protein [Streptomyces sp. NPDC002055]|uniref:DUF4232 domain-containing protein n=1 Tax=Streptomyces sp. NPDC002055 TaxID=3154534 RepID=UPI003319B423
MPSAAPRQSRSLRLAAACLTAVAALALTACNNGSSAGVRISDDATNSLETTGSPEASPSGPPAPTASGRAGAGRGDADAGPDDERRRAGGGGGASGRRAESDARRDTGRTQPGEGAEPGSGRLGNAGPGSGGEAGTGERRAGGGQEPGKTGGAGEQQEGSLGGAFARGDAGGRTGPVCTTANTVLRIKAIERPVRDLVLMATNTSRTACDAASGPRVALGTGRSALDRAENSRSQSVTTIPPGGTVYAGIRLSGTGTGTGADSGKGSGRYVISELRVDFTGTDGKRGAGRPVILRAPGGPAHADARARVTYWLDSMADALTW